MGGTNVVQDVVLRCTKVAIRNQQTQTDGEVGRERRRCTAQQGQAGPFGNEKLGKSARLLQEPNSNDH